MAVVMSEPSVGGDDCLLILRLLLFAFFICIFTRPFGIYDIFNSLKKCHWHCYVV
mgnify:CR=1 FL=1